MREEMIARIAHETNRAYCQSIGDNSQPLWHNAPEWQKASALDGVKFHLETLRAGKEPRPAASHENWLKQKEAEGWKFGPVKDPAKKEHPCFVPYDDLPIEQRQKDYLFAAVVKAVYDCQEGEQVVPKEIFERMGQDANGHWWVSEIIDGEKFVGRPATKREIEAYRVAKAESDVMLEEELDAMRQPAVPSPAE